MGIKFMSLAIDAKTGNSGQKLVLLMLANHCNDHTRQCNPSQKLLAEECSMGLSTLKGHITALEMLGYLETVNVFKDNIQKTNQYILNLPGSQNLAPPPSESGPHLRQNLATEPESKPEYKNKPEFVCQEVWDEFVLNRKRKKAPITELVMKNIIEEAEKAGWTLNDALMEVCVRGWRSFKAEWVKPKNVDKTMAIYEKMMRL